MRTHRTDVQLRFGDTDALGHINNASFASYAELGRLDFLSTLGGSVRSLILASLYIDFRRQVALGDRVRVESWVEKLGRTSMTLAQTIYANDARAADVKSVVVHFDYDTNTAKELTEGMREVLDPFVSSRAPKTPPASR
jgi:acyl-CoA thioester hydrolase